MGKTATLSIFRFFPMGNMTLWQISAFSRSGKPPTGSFSLFDAPFFR